MRKIGKYFILSLILSVLLSIGVCARDKSFVIERYDVDILVEENNVLHITEHINVDFQNGRHGIYREIPVVVTAQRDIEGENAQTTHYIKVKNITVSDSIYGASAPFEQYREGQNLVIMIGKEKQIVRGEVNYTISYDYDIGADGIEEFDELYINIIGTQWDTDINSSSFSISMPKPFDADKLSVTVGSSGFQKNNIVQYSADDSSIYGYSDTKLMPGEGITLRLELPEGYFEGTRSATYGYNVIVAILMGLLTLCSAGLWYLYGRDKKYVQTVEFYPPEGFTPADVGYVLNGSAEEKDIVSLVVYWAQQGYLKITETPDGIFTLTQKRKSIQTMKDYEQTIYNKLFEGRKEVTADALDSDFAKSFLTAQRQLANSFEGDETRSIFEPNSKAAYWVGGALAALIMGLMSLASVYKYSYSAGSAIEAALFVMAEFYAAFVVSGLLGNRSAKIGSINIGPYISTIACTVIAAAVGVIMGIVSGVVWLPILGAVFAAVSVFFASFAKKRTKQGTQWLGKLKGLGSFIETAEKPRIETLVMNDPEYFYHILPYAYVLGITDMWINKFENIAVKKPKWYTGVGTFTSAGFANSITSGLSGFSQSVSASSGSGSGFSGGGVGGGGGGSW